MAALLIFSVAILGLSRAGTQSVAHAQRLTDKAYADIVADNALIRMRFQDVQIGTRSGQESAGGRDFDWRVETRRTPQAGLVELQVEVRRDDDLILTRIAWLSETAAP